MKEADRDILFELRRIAGSGGGGGGGGTIPSVTNLLKGDGAGNAADAGVTVDTDGALAANSDARVPTQKAVVTALATKQTLDADLTSWAAIARAAGFDTFAATPSGANLASLLTTALPATKGGTGLTALGTGVSTALGVNVGTAGAFVVLNGAGGTPSAIVLTNASGLPIGAITGFGANVATALAVAVGSAGAFVVLNGAGGTPSSLVLTNATGLPVGSITGLGTGVGTALAINVGSAGAFVTFNGALGTPSSATLADSLTYTHDLTAVPNQSGGWSEFAVTGSDFTTTNLTATDITGMVTGTLTNSGVYEFEVVCRILNAADTAGVKVAFHGGGTGTAATVFSNNMFNSNSATSVSTGGINAIDTLSPAFLVYSSGEGMWISRGHFIAMSTGTATMSAQIAKVTSGTVTVRKGSKLKIRKLQQ